MKPRLTYAIADLHGRFDLLKLAYEAILSWSNGIPGKIIHLGDYVDRGPESRQIIEFLMSNETVPAGWERICLTGNHEDMMLRTCVGRNDEFMEWWVGNGGGATLLSYGAKLGDFADGGIVPEEHLRWLHGLQRFHVDKGHLYVHAGAVDRVPLQIQSDRVLLWQLYADDDAGWWNGLHVVHGHHQFAYGPRSWPGRTDLDTFAWHTGRLVVGVFDPDLAEGPIATIEVKGPPHE